MCTHPFAHIGHHCIGLCRRTRQASRECCRRGYGQWRPRNGPAILRWVQRFRWGFRRIQWRFRWVPWPSWRTSWWIWWTQWWVIKLLLSAWVWFTIAKGCRGRLLFWMRIILPFHEECLCFWIERNRTRMLFFQVDTGALRADRTSIVISVKSKHRKCESKLRINLIL